MALDTFTWAPSYNSGEDRAPRVIKVKYGDGYEQRSTDGINNDPGVWPLAFNVRVTEEANSIMSFLRAAGGVSPFWWTPPGEAIAIKVKCEKYGKRWYKHNLYHVTAVFEQVFDHEV